MYNFNATSSVVKLSYAILLVLKSGNLNLNQNYFFCFHFLCIIQYTSKYGYFNTAHFVFIVKTLMSLNLLFPVWKMLRRSNKGMSSCTYNTGLTTGEHFNICDTGTASSGSSMIKFFTYSTPIKHDLWPLYIGILE